MAKKNKKTGGVTAKKVELTQPRMVTLYAVGLPPRDFDEVHAARLLKRSNTLWAKKPWPGMKIDGNGDVLQGDESGTNGTSNTSGITGIDKEEE